MLSKYVFLTETNKSGDAEVDRARTRITPHLGGSRKYMENYHSCSMLFTNGEMLLPIC
jgi:hypothetical protein